MIESFTLSLDTTAPAVVFGDAGGTTAGEFFQINYVSDEPLAWATLVDSGDQRFDLVVDDTTLSLLLPGFVYDGWATIEWADDVGNEDSAVAVVFITSPVVVPPPQNMPSPTDARRILHRRLTARTTIVVSSRTRHAEATRTHERHHVPLTVVTTYSLVHHKAHLTTAIVTSRAGRRSLATGHVGVASSATTTIRRRDDPTIEAMLLFGL